MQGGGDFLTFAGVTLSAGTASKKRHQDFSRDLLKRVLELGFIVSLCDERKEKSCDI